MPIEDFESLANGLVKVIAEKDKIIAEYQKMLEMMIKKNDEMTVFVKQARIYMSEYQEAINSLKQALESKIPDNGSDKTDSL